MPRGRREVVSGRLREDASAVIVGHCGRRWCDAVRPSWAASFRSVIHSALDAYCELYGSEAKVLQGVLTCTAEPWWWDRSKCSHRAGGRVLGAARLSVLDSVAEDQRRLWSARRRETLNTARTAAIRQLRREGWDESGWPTLLRVGDGGSVARRAAPALRARTHDGAREGVRSCVLPRAEVGGVCARARPHVDLRDGPCSSKGTTRRGGCGTTCRSSPGTCEGGGAAAFLLRHTGERVFYVAPGSPALGRDDDGCAAVSAGLGGSEGLIAHAEDDPDQEELVVGFSDQSSLRTRPERPPACGLPLRAAQLGGHA